MSFPPDRARIELGVVTQALTSEEAATRNGRTMNAVLAALRDKLGPTATIETTSYAVQPDYQYGAGTEPKITGYTATNLVRVTLDDLARIGTVIDTGTQAGANRIERIQLTLKDEQAARASALQDAAVRARAEATALADTLGVEVVRIVSVVETPPNVQPFTTMAVRREAETPILAGNIEIRATVTLTVEIQRSDSANRQMGTDSRPRRPEIR